MSEIFQTHPIGPTPDILPVLPQCFLATEKCEIDLQIGIFFDGTGNNQDWDEADGCNVGLGKTQREARKDSNVARLFRAYPGRSDLGILRLYVPGVGTPFPEIGENAYATFGPSMGRGGDARINFALLKLLDFLHKAVRRNISPFLDEVILALCRNAKRRLIARTGTYSPVAGGTQDIQALDAVGMRTEGGLLCDFFGARPQAEAFYRRQTQALAEKIANTSKPKLVDITIDVFGFSRGATQARVFCNWLKAMMDGNRLCGVPARIRFLGIFDTVASVGLPSSAGGDGHFSWATPDALRVPPSIQCVHYVAMHENRTSFPLDSLRGPDGALPENHKQFALPGMHSDVGGGYLPGSQGRSPSGQHDDMLSQIPLELMYQAARTAQVPLNRDLAIIGKYDPFAVHPDLRQAHAAFMQAERPQATTARWLLSYLAWRYQVRDVYATELSWVTRARASTLNDFNDLAGANQTLMADIAVLEGESDKAMKFLRAAIRLNPSALAGLEAASTVRRAALASEAQDVLTHIKAHPILGTPENPEHLTPQAYLFANYMHDSYAGFRPFDQPLYWAACIDPVPTSWESQGYLRFRRVYQGTGKPVTHAPPTEQQLLEAEQREREAQLQTIQSTIDMGKVFSGPW